MPLYRRTPKRGFKPVSRVTYQVVNVRDLERIEADTIGPAELIAAGVAGSSSRPIKLLGVGEVERAVTLKVHACSKAARVKVEAVGGRVELIARHG